MSKQLGVMMHADREMEDFVDFIDKCIEWKPDRRMTPLDAFEHPWIVSGLQELRPKVAE
jgi:serine/threonine protein kinase